MIRSEPYLKQLALRLQADEAEPAHFESMETVTERIQEKRTTIS